MGGFKLQGKDEAAAARILEDALAVEEAGAFCIVLEMIPASLAAELSQKLTVPTIGIGAGPDCDGQVLVCNDLLGLDERFKPKFVKRFAELAAVVEGAARDYVAEVKSGAFPSPANVVGGGRVQLYGTGA